MAWVSLRRLLCVGALVGAAFSMSSCSHGQSLGQARTACTQVTKALATLKASTAAGLTPRQAQELVNKAQDQLIRALPSAAAATSGDGSYNALMTNIQEAQRVPMDLLVPSLTRQCEVIRSNTPYLGS